MFGIDWDETRGEHNTVFLPFSCSQTIELAGRHGTHDDLKPIHGTGFAKILIQSVYVNAVNLFLSETSSGSDRGLAAKRMGSFSRFVIYSVTLSGVLGSPPWFPHLKNEGD